MGFDNLTEGVSNLVTTTIGAIKENPVASSIGAGAIALGVGGAIATISRRKNSRRSKRTSKHKKRIKHTRRGLKQDRKRRSKQKWEVAYQRRKRKLHRKLSPGIHYTKKGQPYKILASGKARFIKKTKRRYNK